MPQLWPYSRHKTPLNKSFSLNTSEVFDDIPSSKMLNNRLVVLKSKIFGKNFRTSLLCGFICIRGHAYMGYIRK